MIRHSVHAEFIALLLLAGLTAIGVAPADAASPPTTAGDGQIDQLVFNQLARLHIQPAALCSDAVFLRRAFLDVIGTLPTEQEAIDFLLDKSASADKRAALIDRLMDRREFPIYWAMKWGELLRIKAEFPINLWPNAAQGYHRWVAAAIRENKPYDRFAYELLTGNGSNFRVPTVNFYRAVQGRQPAAHAGAVALTFMGVRTSNWSKEQLAGTAVFFSQIAYKPTGEWKEEVVYFDPSKLKAPADAVFPDGTRFKLAPDRDGREVFAVWLIDPKNPWFARNAVNRVWYWLMGRGIVHEPDDIRGSLPAPDNPPSNPELLAWLERELVGSHYDLRHIYRLILTSKVYQLSASARDRSPAAAANFASYPLRQLDAEVLIDALCQITGVPEKYVSMIPEPFTIIPDALRAIDLPDSSISSPFLELFGRPPRDTGLASERNNRPSGTQRLHVLNSTHVQRKLDQGPRLSALVRPKATPAEIVTSVYLTILSRYPSEGELKIAVEYFQSPIDEKFRPRDAVTDLAWALINNAEFLYRH